MRRMPWVIRHALGIRPHNLVANLLATGRPLAEVEREAEHGLAFGRRARVGLVADVTSAQLAFIRNLRGLTTTFGRFDQAQFDEREFEQHLAGAGVPFAACSYWIRKIQARFMAGDYATAVEASLNAQRLLWTLPSVFESAEAHFYGALSHAASCDAASSEAHGQHLQALTAHHQQLEGWTDNCRENFENRALLVGAEIARLEGRELEAEPPVRSGDPVCTRARVRSERSAGQRAGGALLRQSRLREDCQGVPAGRSGRLPAVGCRGKGPAARGAVSAISQRSIGFPIRRGPCWRRLNTWISRDGAEGVAGGAG